MIRGPIDGKYVELWGIPAWRRKLGIGDESMTLEQRIQSIISDNGGPDSGPGSVDNANARLAAFATLEEAGYIVQTSTFPPAFAGRRIYSFTDNQIHVTNGTGINGDTLLQLPQDIHAGATPEFLTIKPSLLDPEFVTYVNAVGELDSTTVTATTLETAVASAIAMDVLTTRGDLLSHDGTTYIRVPVGAANTVTRTDGLDVLWGKVVLTTDVTGVLPVANGGTNASSWTAGSVIFAGAGGTSLTQDNANFFYDDTNNRLGIGTAAPGVRLDVRAAGASKLFNFSASSAGTGYIYGTIANTGGSLRLGVEASSGGQIHVGGLVYASIVGSDGARALQLGTDNTVRLTILPTSGNVGIGTTAPGVLFDLGLAGTKLGVMRLAGSTSGNVTIQPQAVAGTWTLTLPTTDGNAGEALITDGGGITSWAVPVGAAHAVLSATHSDTLASAVSRGSLIVGNATPLWAELNIGAAARLLRSDGTDATWAQAVLTTDVTGILPIANGGTNASSFNSGRVTYFDGTRLTDDDGLTYIAASNSLTLGVANAAADAIFQILQNNAPRMFLFDVGDVGATDYEALRIDKTSTGGHIYTIANGTGTARSLNLGAAGAATAIHISTANFVKIGDTTDSTAVLHLIAGTAAAGTAPFKLTSGTVLGTPEVGTMEYNNRFFLTDTDAVRRHIVQAANATKVTAGAPYANDGYVDMVIGGTTVRVMTTA